MRGLAGEIGVSGTKSEFEESLGVTRGVTSFGFLLALIACSTHAFGESIANRVASAEYRANLAMCLDGRYPVLCHHALLAPADASRVSSAE